MTSNINPNNIDGAYPVAGQDNDSQGFRDNFTNTKTNFEYAAAEITDLQNNVLLKSALVGGNVDNDMNGQTIYNGVLQEMGLATVALGTISGTANIDFAVGSYYSLTTSGPVSLNFQNWPTSGTLGQISVSANIVNISHTLTVPSSVNQGTNNIQGWSNNVITFNAPGIYEFLFESRNVGGNVTIIDQNRNPDPIYLPSLETLTSNTDLSLSVTTSVINKTSDYEGNLASGIEGQTKVVICGNATPGSQALNVVGAGWQNGGNGTITFSSQGQTATLMYLDGAWWVTGTGPDATDTYPAIS